MLYRYLRHKREKGLNTKVVLIVGISETTKFLRKIIESNPMLGYYFVGFASSKIDEEETILGKKEDLDSLISEYNVHVVLVSLSIFSETNHSKEYLKICNRKGVRLFFVPENQQWFKTRTDLESLGDILIINPQRIPLDDLSQRILKRIFDVIFSLAIILLVFSWLFPIIMLLIKL